MPSPHDLCTVNDVRLYSPNVQGNNLDGLIESLISTESSFIEDWCQRRILDRGVDIVQTFNGEGAHLLPLPAFPITAVSAVVVDGEVWTQALGPYDIGYRWSARYLIARGQVFPRGYGNIQVTYRGGYTKANLPDSLRQACIELVDLRLQERKRQGQTSKSLGGEQVTYQDREMPQSIAERIGIYQTVIAATSDD